VQRVRLPNHVQEAHPPQYVVLLLCLPELTKINSGPVRGAMIQPRRKSAFSLSLLYMSSSVFFAHSIRYGKQNRQSYFLDLEEAEEVVLGLAGARAGTTSSSSSSSSNGLLPAAGACAF